MARVHRSADWLAVPAARERVLAGVPRLPGIALPLSGCLGAVLASDAVSPIDLPQRDNSAMDGYAVLAKDIRGASSQRPVELPVTGDVAAGGVPAEPLRRGTAVRVMTGAAVPEGTDSVVRVEHTESGAFTGGLPSRVRIISDSDAECNVRPRGEDIRSGERVLRSGQLLRPADLGVAASIGCGELEVIRRPVVAVMASGDELVDLSGFDEVLAGRRIVSSNSYTLAAQLSEIGAEVRDLGIASDDPARMREILSEARGADALITSAGISMGEHDLVLGVLEGMGLELDFWRVRMKPGSPFAFGHVGSLGGIPWFGLPGNPVSSMVTFEVLVRPALLRMAGHTAVFTPDVAAVSDFSHPTPQRLTHFLRARLAEEGETRFARPVRAQGSGVLTSMAAADALVVVPEAVDRLDAGQTFRAIVLGGAPLRETPGY